MWTAPTALRLVPLIVLPRQLNESVDAQRRRIGSDWEAQEDVRGSTLRGSRNLSTPLYGIARVVGLAPSIRRIWGGHYQGWNNPTPHPEDNTADNSTVNEYRDKMSLLRAMLDGPN